MTLLNRKFQDARTRYKKGVKPASVNMLKRGKQNKKLGDKVSVKQWKGMTMYSLTLEERATCPTSCKQWDVCYGNNMPFAHRFDHTDPNFEPMLRAQLECLSLKHPEGFVVRLHVLGDFYDHKYVNFWKKMLMQFPNMNAFGYTHWPYKSKIGAAIGQLNNLYPDRWRIRYSDEDQDVTDFIALVEHEPGTTNHVICPEQQGKTPSCADCGFCWSSEKPILFIEH